MRIMPLKELERSNHFYFVLLLSILIHFVFLNLKQQSSFQADFAVKQAPNSINIQFIEEISESTVKEKEAVEDVMKTEELSEWSAEISENLLEINEDSVPWKEERLSQESFEKTAIKNETISENDSSFVLNESKGAVTQAKPLEHINPAPLYPRLAQRKGWEGIVYLNVSINPLGTVNNVQIKKSSGYSILDIAAVKAIREWKFMPAAIDDRKVSSAIVLPVEFQLK